MGPIFAVCSFQPHGHGQDISRVMDYGLRQPAVLLGRYVGQELQRLRRKL